MRPPRLKALLLACAATAALALPFTVHAETAKPADATASNQLVRYDPDYFKEFQVTTALDMVFHVPGFSFSGGQDVRGFAGAAGNVLIDGQRPASKQGLGDTLENINASQVDHVELITGGAPGIDMQGYRQIVNVVRKSDGKASISFGGNVKFFPGDPMPAGFFNYSKNAGGKSTALYMEAFRFNDNGVQNTKRYTYTPDFSDTTPDYMFIKQKGGGWGNQIKLDHSRPLLGGKVSFNSNYNPIYYDFDALYDAATDGVEHLDYNEINNEFGLQYERKLTKSTTLDMNLLRRHNHTSQDDVYTDTSGVYHYTSLDLTDEHILSAKLTWQHSDKLTFKFGAENAFNSRDSNSLFIQNNSTQNVPSNKVRVEEDRNEYFIVSNWQALPKVNVEAAIKVETSTISVKQDNRSQSFVYPKPKLQIVWSPTDKIKVSWLTERQLGQLNFNDFASSVNLQTTVIKAGNSGVVPQKQWINSLTLDYSFWDKGAVSLNFEHDDLQDTLDHLAIVTTSGVYDARGNIGDGTIDKISTSLNLPLDKLKVKGGLLKVDYTYRRTHVIDPITHAGREISGKNPSDYSISFSQNLPQHKSSWGIDLESLNNSYQYNARELYRYKSAPWMTLWAEYKTKDGIIYGFIWQNPLRRRDEYTRTTWSGLRDQSPIVQQEHDVSFMQPWVILRVRKELK